VTWDATSANASFWSCGVYYHGMDIRSRDRVFLLVVGTFVLSLAVNALVTGKAVNVYGGKDQPRERPARSVTRTDSPVLFYAETALVAGIGGAILFMGLRKR
jgi:hypothetical protein